MILLRLTSRVIVLLHIHSCCRCCPGLHNASKIRNLHEASGEKLFLFKICYSQSDFTAMLFHKTLAQFGRPWLDFSGEKATKSEKKLETNFYVQQTYQNHKNALYDIDTPPTPSSRSGSATETCNIYLLDIS